MRLARHRSGTVVILLLLLAVACNGSSQPDRSRPSAPPPVRTSSAQPTSPATSPGAGADWPTYHGDTARTGHASVAPLRPPLHRAWTRHLDGAVYAQPIVVGDTVVVATENNTLYALRAGDGGIRWRRHLGTPVPASALPCGNIDPTGITGTPAYDAQTHLVFAATETTGSVHTLHAVDLRTGRERWQRNLDVTGRDRAAEQQRGAVLVLHGRVYVAFGGRFGDCGDYVGYVTGVATSGRGRIDSYAVPTDREAGIWAPPGPVAGPGGEIYVASGNGAATGGRYDGSDSVIALSPTLHRDQLFAPTSWAQDNAQDLDLGSSSPVIVPGGHIVIAGKRGTVYLLAARRLGGIGGEVATLTGCAAYGGGATVGSTVVLPCIDGIRALTVRDDRMHWRWRVAGVAGSPVIAGSVVYALDTAAGDLVEVGLGSGAVRTRIHVGEVTRFATPAPAGGHVFIGTVDGIVAVAGGG